MTDPKYAKVSTPVEELWNSHEAFVNLEDYIKYNYSLDEWLQLIRQLPDPSGIEKITLVGSDVRRTIETYQDRNHQYLHLVTQLLQRSFPKTNIHHLTSRNPDQALVYMASANWLLVGNGGFGQMAKACVNYGNEKGKQRGLSEPFGFMLVAVYDTRLTEPERRFFETHYVDTDNYFKRSFGRPWPKFLEQYM